MRRRKSAVSDAVSLLLVVLALLVAGIWRVDIPSRHIALIRPAICVAGGAAALGLLMGMRRAIRCQWKAESIFLLLFVPLSLGMMIVLPIWRAPDEPAHLQRAWQISIGQWFPDEESGGVFYEPENFLEGVRDAKETRLYHVVTRWNSPMDMDNLVESDVGANTGIYPVSNYFPQAMGMALVRLFTRSRMAIFYGARLAAWLVTLALFYYAVKRIPVGKTMLIALTLMPMMLQEAVSASADGMTCAASAAFAAFVISACMNPERLSWRGTAELFLLMALIGTLKMMYCPLILLSLAIPDACFGSKKRKYATLIGMMAVVLGFALLWMLFCNANYVGAETGRGGAMREQLAQMLQYPAGFLAVLGRTVFYRFGSYAEQLIGKDLSWLNLPIPSLIFWALAAALCRIAQLDDGLPGGMDALRRSGMALCGLCALIIFVGLYIWETPLGNETVLGVQGRYFIPLLPVLYAALKRGTGAPKEKAEQTLLAMALIDICALGFAVIQTVV